MSLVSDLAPINILSEKKKFFEDQTYNPQFEYVRELSEEERYSYGHPVTEYYNCARDLIIQRGNHQKSQPSITTEEDVTRRLEHLLTELRINYPLKVFFMPELISRCSINSERIVFRLPIEFTDEDFSGLMNHEIQTHLLRRINNQKQPWSGQKASLPVRLEREFTEEGLANIHSFIEQEDKAMHRSWVNYVAVYLGQQCSFTDTFHELLSLGIDEQRAWYATVRTKRGIKDTSQPGGNTKGLVYLNGAVRIWSWISDHQNNPRDLYIGRVSLSEVEEKSEIAEKSGLIFPTFMSDLDQYRGVVQEIAKINRFDILKQV